MDEKQLMDALNAIGVLSHGKITIRKEIGKEQAETETDMHPILALFAIVQAFADTLYDAAHTGDALELDISGDNLSEIVHGISDLIIKDVKSREE